MGLRFFTRDPIRPEVVYESAQRQRLGFL